jgi:hypothetical protein
MWFEMVYLTGKNSRCLTSIIATIALIAGSKLIAFRIIIDSDGEVITGCYGLILSLYEKLARSPSA